MDGDFCCHQSWAGHESGVIQAWAKNIPVSVSAQQGPIGVGWALAINHYDLLFIPFQPFERSAKLCENQNM
jgi:hypothetical protein